MLASLWPLAGMAQEPEPVVHAILFYSPTCPHCHEVITNHLLPLQNEFGEKFLILGFDTSQGWAGDIFWKALQHFKVPEEKWAVPLMIVGDEILVGGSEIPARIRAILEEGLQRGGIDLPNLPALLEFMEEQGLIDHRYPDRRIALQDSREAPQQAQDSAGGGTGGQREQEASPDSIPEAAADSVQAADSTVAPTADSVQAADSTVAPTADSVPVRDSAAAVRAETPDSVSEEEVPVPVEDTRRDSVMAADTSDTARDPAGGPDAPVDAVPDPTEPGPGSDSAAGASSAGSRTGSGGSLGLQEAATRLESMTLWDRFNQDRAGNSLSVLILLGMIVSLIFTGFPPTVKRRPWPRWLVPVMVLVGVGVASYLSFVEVTQAEAVCGPVGDCNTVNQSEYATFFGVLPVGVLGLLGYALILVLWGVGHWGPESLRRAAKLGFWAAALFGVAFSIYLTFLEPFVIGATCAWCLSSAVIMTLLLWAAAPEAAEVWPGTTRSRPIHGPGS